MATLLDVISHYPNPFVQALQGIDRLITPFRQAQPQ
jgi:hypothetical protein